MGINSIPFSAKQVRNLALSVYDLIPVQHEQLEMFATKSRAVAKALDKINNKYGESVQYACFDDGDGSDYP